MGNTAILRVENLTKDFGGLRALDRVDFAVAENQIKALIGPNGAGKTTLFNVIGGFLFPTDGKVFFQEEEVTYLKTHLLSKKGIGRTFQTPQIVLDMSVLDNVMVGFYLQTKSEFIASGLKLKKTIREEERVREKSLEILDSLNLRREATLEARRLPFAQMRLVEIGRALAINPKILLLDEPSAGLNPYETEQMGEVLKKYKDLGVTILFIEHDIDLVMRISDEIVVLNHGQKIAEGTPTQIRTDAKVISSYLGEAKQAHA